MENDNFKINGEPEVLNLNTPKKTGEIYFQFESLIDGNKNLPIKICDVQDFGEFSIHIDTKPKVCSDDVIRFYNADQNITFHDNIGKVAMTIFVKQQE